MVRTLKAMKVGPFTMFWTKLFVLALMPFCGLMMKGVHCAVVGEPGILAGTLKWLVFNGRVVHLPGNVVAPCGDVALLRFGPIARAQVKLGRRSMEFARARLTADERINAA